MSASPKRIDAALVAELRKLADGEKPHLGEIRRAVAEAAGGCSTAELRASIARLRNRGKLHWERIELAPSMLLQETEAPAGEASPEKPGPCPEPRRREPFPGPIEEIGTGGAEPVALSPRAPAPPPPAPAPARPPIAEAVAVEAGERRRQAASIAQPWKLGNVRPEGVVETIQSGLAETPGDLIKAVGRRHPDLWRRVLLLGRAHGVMPSVALYDALDRGLTVLEGAEHGVSAGHAARRRA